MKKSLCLIALILACSSGRLLAQGAPSLTADYYVSQPEKWMDKSVGLNVAWLKIPTGDKEKDGYRELSAATFNSGKFGGYITVLAKPEAVPRLVQLCGTQAEEYTNNISPHMIQGTFVKFGSKYALKVDK